MSAKSDQFWVDIFKPKWNLSYIDGARLRDSEPVACEIPPYIYIYGLGARELLQRPPEAPATQNSTGPGTGPGMWALGGGAEGPPLRRPA